MNFGAGIVTIILSLICALVLSVFHLPDWAPPWLSWLRPSWLVLVLFFLVMELPQHFGMVRAWILGLVLDVLLGEPLGVNAFCLAALTYVTWSNYERLRMYTVLQQAVVIFAMVMCIELFKNLIWVQFLDAKFHLTFLWVASASALAWPLVYILLSRSRSSRF